MFWVNLALYQMVWFVSVIGAAHGTWWPAGVGAVAFAAWRIKVSSDVMTECRLVAVALLLGFFIDGALVRSGLATYAASWPAGFAPAWILALWAAFALSIVPLFGYLHARPHLAAALGAIGGPLAYLGAARGWHVVQFATPMWRGLLALACGWGVAMPLLATLARHWLHNGPNVARSVP
ncbi:DUF2878 domain-containing protein [Dyella sp. 2HG41-7]|uniref:DUF2878 domain-containing protein n=1 Tax=Dyella sp. 2HG41-7 TaxID=2883239 RepID=UPI001F430771|nr:DUF2878 domain-containing protein [Dyella sp. 2HG41-7]